MTVLQPTPDWKFVEARWVDACSFDAWHSLDEIPDTVEVLTRGWLVKDEAQKVCIAGSYQMTGDGLFGGSISIPRGCIISLTEIPTQKKGAVIYDFETGLKSE